MSNENNDLWFYEVAVKKAENIARAAFEATMTEELGQKYNNLIKFNFDPKQLKYLGKRHEPEDLKPTEKQVDNFADQVEIAKPSMEQRFVPWKWERVYTKKLSSD